MIRAIGSDLGGAAIRRHGGGAPSGDWRNLRLADFTQFNEATYISGSVTDLGGSLGWSIPLLGGAGKSVADPFDGWHAIQTNPMTDAYGAAVAVAKEWAAWLGLHELSGFVAASDIDIVIGVTNVAVDGAANDWTGNGFRWGASRAGFSTNGSNGVATAIAGGALAGMRRIRFPVFKAGTTTSAALRTYLVYQDDTNATVNAGTGTITGITTSGAGNAYNGWADATPRLFIAASRTSITDGVTRTPVFQPLIHPPFALNLPA